MALLKRNESNGTKTNSPHIGQNPRQLGTKILQKYFLAQYLHKGKILFVDLGKKIHLYICREERKFVCVK